jgi:spermidine synthase
MFLLARDHFRLKNENAVDLIRADAFSFVASCPERFDLVVVDLFHDLDLAPGVEEGPFLAATRRLASPKGLVLINAVIHDEKSASRSARLRDELRLHFTEVLEQRYEGNNRVYIAL